MANRKYKKSDKDVRSALWIAYDKKDVYTGDLLRYREMEVDHIIPQELYKDEKRITEILVSLGLNKDFEKDSLENFVPTRRGPNSFKSDSIDLVLIRNTLNKARSMKPKVEKLINDYNKESDLISAATKVALLADNEEKKQDVTDIIFDEENEFECKEDLIGNQFTKSECRVRIQASLPTLKENRPSCSFMFRPIKLRECTITVNHEEIFAQLFIGNGEEDLSKRPFVGYEMDDGSYTINLGGCFFYLSKIETTELCDIVDRYNEVYFNKIKELEEAYSLNGMKVNQYSEIKICTLKKDFCKILFYFINSKHKDEKWDIFEINNILIKVYTDRKNKEYNSGYHAIIQVREEDGNVNWYDDRNVGLYLKTYYDDKYSKVSHKDWWSPIEVKNWLIKELFPICLKEHCLEKRIKNKKDINYEEECKRYYCLEKSKEIKVDNSLDINELNDKVRTLQSFYANYRQRRVKFSSGSNKLYHAMLLLIEGCTEKPHIPYIAGNLGIKCESLKELKEYFLNEKNKNQTVMYYSQIELLLRCFIECIEKGRSNLSLQSYTEFWLGMDDIVNEYNYHIIRERYL